jgi:hypothetical protein
MRCAAEGCERDASVREFCGGHYQRHRKYGDVHADRPLRVSRKHLLIVNPSNSRCGNCGKGALPTESKHDTVLGYFPIGHDPGPGCGVRWVFIDSDYRPRSYAFDDTFRPDLVRVDEALRDLSRRFPRSTTTTTTTERTT